MDVVTAGFVDGIGAAAATSGVLSQPGTCLRPPVPYPGTVIARPDRDELQQSKRNISVNIRGLVEWHLVRRISVERSRSSFSEEGTRCNLC
jgi:hypothetical protein